MINKILDRLPAARPFVFAIVSLAALAVQATITVDTTKLALPDGLVGESYLSYGPGWLYFENIPSYNTFDGGTSPYTITVKEGTTKTLPPGMNFYNSSNVNGLSGTPTTPGYYEIEVTITDANNESVDAIYTITIIAPPFVVNDAKLTLASGEVGKTYSAYLFGSSDYQKTFSGGVPPYTVAVKAGTDKTLPPGLSILGSGTSSIRIYGTPTTAGSYETELTVSDSGDVTTNITYSITIAEPALEAVAGKTTLDAITQHISTSINLAGSVTGGTTPYSYTVKNEVGNALPAGLTLSSGGVISGTPTVAGDFSFKITVTDSSSTPLTLDVTYTLSIAAPDPLTASTNLGRASVGNFKSIDLAGTISGGVPPYTFGGALASGSLPPGFSYDHGVVSGTATTAGEYSFSVAVTDNIGTSDTFTYTLTTAVSTGFTDDDPEEPESGVTVNCLTPDGVFPRTCNQVASSSTAVVWENSWYYVTGNVDLSKGVVVNGKVSLILGDGATLTVQGASSANAGIRVVVDGGVTNSLTIYCQSGGTGKLIAKSGGAGAGIGGDNKTSSGTGLGDCGKVTIYGGVIEATGGSSGGAGIGGGDWGGSGGTVTIYDGTVTAAANSSYASGIGGGYNSVGGDVAIYGGSVIASSKTSSYAGIGGNSGKDQGTLTVGGNIVVKAGSSSTLTDANIQNPNGETEISLSTIYQYYQTEMTGPTPLAQTTSAFAAYVGQAFEQALSATVSGGTPTYSFVQKSGTLPAGLTFNAGVISGTPTATASATVVFTVTDSGIGADAQSEDFSYTITVTYPPKSITYIDSRDGTTEQTGLVPAEYAPGVGATLPATATAPNGYTFAGWYANAECTGAAVTTVGTEATENLTFYAKWTPTVYTITYMDGSTPMSGLTPTTYTIEAAATLPETATKAGYGFYGWYDNAGCTGDAVTTIPANSTGDKTFYAKWGVVKSNETYIDASGNAHVAECVEIGSDTTSLVSGWYAVKGNVTIYGKVTVSGDVNILLCDGASLTINAPSSSLAIEVKGANTLTIYGQENGTGALTANANSWGPGIGSTDSSNPCGTITINGGIVTAVGTTGAGIGGGYNNPGGTVIVNGGTVIATGDSGGAGIGGYGTSYKATGSLVVSENVIVMAKTADYGATFTVKPHGANGEITLEGERYYKIVTPKITTVPYRDADGVMKSAACKLVTVDINALETGWYAVTNNIDFGVSGVTISGDVRLVIADGASLAVEGLRASPYSAGINVPVGSSLTIYGQEEGAGAITAIGGYFSAGIGGNYQQSAGAITINGCNITAIANSTYSGAAGIGGGGNGGNGGTVTINGGRVEATGNAGAGIGKGQNGTNNGTLIVNSTMSVMAGSNADSVEELPRNETTGEITLGNQQYFLVTSAEASPLAQTVNEFAAYVDDAATFNLAETVSGGTKPYAFALKAGSSLPAGFTLSGAILTNDAVSAGGTFVMTVTDSSEPAQSEDFTYTITVAAHPKTINYMDGETVLTGLTPTEYVEGTGATLPATAIKTGYTFAGWRDNAGLTGDAVTAIGAEATGNKTFWAKWTPVEYAIYYWDGSSLMSGLTPSSYTIEAAATLPATATKTGYGFYGWYANSGLTGDPVATIPAGSTGIKSFYAKWGVVKTPESYVDAGGDSHSVDCVAIGSDSTTLESGWYVVKGSVSINSKVTVSGDVNILLADDASLSVYSSSYGPAIEVKGDNSLSIYGQTKGNGALTVTATSGPAIGSSDSLNYCGTITINGGVVTATGNYAGIGGGWDQPGGSVFVYGGTVFAKSTGNSNAGIGGSYNHKTEGSLTVGENVIVMAKASDSAANPYVLKPRGADGTITLAGEQCYKIITPKTAEVSYRDVDGSEKSAVCKAVSEDVNGLVDGWYAVMGDVNLGTLGMAVSGNVNLVLVDGATLVVTGANNMAAIHVPSNSSLTIYGQFGGTGAIQAVGGYHGAGIGGTNGTSSVASAGAAGTIVVNGGNITAIGGNYAAGIGGGYYGGCEAVTVNNGTVTAIAGSNYGAGIGGGYNGNGAVVTISGGTVTATGGSSGGAGIGGGNNGMGGAVTISGGTVTATGGSDGAGIGGGSYCSGAPVTISGGTVTAIGGSSAAGIGGGSGGNGDDVVVTGGSVTASGGLYSPGIGRGSLGTSRGTLTVTPAIIIVKAGASENPTAELTPDSNNQISLANDYRYFVLESTEAAPLSQVSGMLDAYAGEVTALPLAGTVSGGVPQYTFAFSGDHPEGVTLSDARTLSVAATVPAGEYTFAMTVTDSDAPARSETFTYKLTVTVKPTYYSITYMDGTTPISGLEPTTYDVGVGTNLPVTVEKNGYSFNLWYRDIDLTDGPYSCIPSDATGDKTFYAKWTRLNYTIYYYDEDGTTQFSGLVPTSYSVESDTFTLPMPPEREGYDFVGWYANASFTGSPVTQVAKGSYGTKRFYAKWSKVVQPDEVVPVSFVDENGTAMTTNCVVLTSDNVASLSSGWYALTNSLSLNATVEIAGNVKLVLCDDQTLVVTGANYMAGIGVPLGSTLTVYAQAGGSGAISAVGATYAAGIGGRSGSISDATQGSAGTIVINGGVITAQSGNDFAAGIGGGSQGNGADVTVNRGLVTATGGANAPGIGGGYSSTSNGLLKVPSTMVVKAGASANPTERLDVDSETGIVSFEGKPKYFIVKTAEGEAAAHSITYMDGEAAISGLKPVTFYEGTGVATLPTPAAKTGYDFSGWYANAGFTGEPVGSIAASAVENVTLYARYTPIEYTIAYKDGATTLTSLTPTSYTIESAAITLPTPEASGDKVFGGWYTSSTLTGDPVTTIPAGSTGDKTFYAKWEAVKVNASYIDASGTAQTAECIEIDTSSTTLETGWYVVNGDVVLNSTVMISGDVNLILANGASFVVTGTQYKAAINVTGENSLTIYGQAGGTGRLEAIAVSIAAGIGGNNSQACGTVTINGGIIVAAGNSGAGIGGGMGGNGGIVTINGGNVTALGGFRSAGIGGGYENSEGGIVRINGGIVTASSGTANVAGIGGGYGTSNNGELTVAAKVVVKAGSSSTLTDADILNPAGETEIALSSTYQYYSIERVGPEPLSQTTGALAAYVGEEASFNLAETVSGGTPAYAFALKTGTIPSGMTLSGSTIAGVPADTGVSTLVFTVTDSGSGVDAQSEDFTYTLTVSRHSRTITYMDGETVMTGLMPTNYVEGTGATLPVPAAKAGYTFDGWRDNAGLTGDAVTTIGTEATGNKTFWAKWIVAIANASYIDADGRAQNAECIEIGESATTLETGWYVVKGDVTIDSTVTIVGSVNLILADGASLTVNGSAQKAGINVAPGNSLAIYGQTEGTGTLTASDYSGESSISVGGAGIGGNDHESCGTITINGGTITATSKYAGAGIGGGAYGNGGTVTINGGTVTATGGSWYGAGIGGGYRGNGANVTIMGGTVIASGGSSNEGSGDGCNGIGKGNGYGNTVGSLTVGPTVSVKAGAAPNPQTDITPQGGGSVNIVYQRYFKTEDLGLLQTTGEISAYTGESKSWNLADTIIGGVTPYTFTPVAGVEPPSGLTLVGTTLSGAVAAANTYTIKYTVTDSSVTPLNFEAVYTLTVSTPDPLAAQTNLGKAKVGKAKSVDLSSTVSGGVPPYTFAFSGSHASEFSIDGSVLTILADSVNTYTCGITVTDSFNTQLNATYSIEVVEPAKYIDDDPEEPEDGDVVTVDCLTVDGVYPRACHPVTSTQVNVIWSNSWYYVTGNVTLTRGVTVNGKVSLILGDNATLTVSQSDDPYGYKAGINVSGDNSLVIYAQSSGANVGRLIATGAGYAAGIGGDQYQSCGKVTIVSGSITASSLSTTYYGAGIGGGQSGNGGIVTIYGGTVVAQCQGSGAGGAGIGSGGSSSSTDATHGGTLTVYGGTVTASASNNGAGIGGGKYGSGGMVSIYGGTVTATASSFGAAIGGGSYGNGGTVVISNGTVTATASSYGAGIGGGYYGNGGTVSVYGGNVTATTGSSGGIGIGKGAYGSSNGELTVGEDVDVTAGTNADTAVPLDPVVIGTQRYFHFAAYVPTPIVQAKSALYAYAGEAMSLTLPDTISGGRKPYTFTGTLPQGLTIDGGATLAGTLAAGTYNFTLAVTDVKGVSESFGYTLTVVERTGFIDDDPDEPENGVMVSCRTASGAIGLRTCNQVTSSPSTAVTWENSWYYVSGNVTLGKGVTVVGKVSLILGDDASLTINGSVIKAGINVADGNSLVIYGQEGGTGALMATGGSSGAGIGGNSGESCGKVVICGGVVTAQSSAQGAGIGGGFSGTCGTIIVNGGTVNATGSSNGAGIGGGSSASQGGTVTINGGTVNATGGQYGAGVGGGNSGAGGNVIINGGYLTATGGSSGAGIGGGNSGSGGAVKINGGTVRASTSSAYTHNSAPKGIGKGSNGTSNGTLTVEPGTTVQVGFDPTSTLTTLTAVNKEITLGNYRYFEIDGPRPLSQAETTLSPVYTGANSSWTLSDTIDGGIPTYTFALKSGSSLPDGLSLLSGVLTGRPSAANTYTFTLVVTDSASNSIDAEYTLVVTDPPEMTVALPDFGNATKGINKSYTLSTKVSGGVTPYTSFAVTSGSVPPGLSLSNAGVLSGTPTTPGNYSFTVTIRDSALPANSCDVEFTLSVKDVYHIYYYDGETKLSPTSSYTTYVEGEYKALSYAPTKSGYLFVGWNDADGNRVIRIEDTDTGDKTFYAEWEERVATKSMTFIDADGSERTETCTVIYSDTGTTLESGWYVARGSVSFTGGLTVNGTTASPVHLVLEDGCSLTVSQSVNNNAGISVATGKSLVIYGQSKNTGTLNVTGGNYGAAIGGGSGAACGEVTINGGTVNAGGTASSNRGAGIGGGYNSSGAGGNGGTVTINGGNVTASSSQSAGIGGGRGGLSGTYSYTYYKSGDGGTVTINGGNVTAIGGSVCAGIGGAGTTFGTSYAGSGGTVTITGGNVTATGDNRGAGIGGGLYGSGGTVTITGGRVVATGGEQSNTYFGAGIGAGNGGESQGSLTVEDVIVKAGNSENPETELTPTAGEIALGGERYYVVASASAATVSDITYMSGDTTLSGVSPANYTEGEGADLSTAVPIKTGYTFCGWYDNADLTGDEVTAISAESTGPVTLWAKWEPTVFTITYIGQNGITPITDLTPTNYTILSDTITLPAPPAPEGKMFDGWYTQYDFSTPDVSVIAAGSSGNKTYYAKWATVSKVSVEFVGADGLAQTEQCRPLALGVTELRNGGWYVVNSALNYGANGLTVHGVVNLVLADGASLVVTGSTQQAGITVTHGNALNIYAQSLGTGTINASGAISGAGIGGNSHADCGTVTIYGGVINATGRGGAAIGGGESGNGGTVTINGGTVNANGFTSGAGIGGGHSGDGGLVTINGGTVTAIGGMSGGAGIGGGDKGISTNKGNGGIVRINGGTVVAIGGETEGYGFGAGIGAGRGATDQGSLFVGESMTAFAGNSADPTVAPARDATTGEVTLSGEQYYTVAPTSASTSFSITYMNGEQVLSLSPDTYASGDGATLPTAQDMVRSGATFGGWYESADFSGSAVTAIEPGSTGEKTFYAKWNVEYVAMDGTTQTHGCTEVTSATTGLAGGWYVVTGSVAFDSTLEVSGTTHLVLARGASLSASAAFLSGKSGVEIASGETLTVYGQPDGSGTFQARASAGASGENPAFGGTLAIAARMVAKYSTSVLERNPSTGVVSMARYGTPVPTVTISSVLSTITYVDTVAWENMTGLAPTNYYEGTGATLPTAEQVGVKPGYTFEGWYAASDCSGLPVLAVSATDTGAKTYYAKFDSTDPAFTIVDGKLTKINPKGHHEVTIPEGVREIASSVLWYIDDDNKPAYYDVTNVIISSTVTNIFESAFWGSYLTSIVIPGNVKIIGRRAFTGCTNLLEVTIEDGVEFIGDSAFANCTALTTVSIPGSVDTLRDDTFYGCVSLTSVTMASGVKTIGGWVFANCTSLTDISFPEGLDGIGYCAFYKCTGLTSIVIPKGVAILDSAFYRCTGLKTVNISGTVVTPKKRLLAASGRRLLAAAEPDPEATTVGNFAFYGCSELESALIGSKVNEIGGGTFSGCTKLKTIIVEDGNEHYANVAGMLLTADGTTLISGAGDDRGVTVPYGVTTVEDGAFAGSGNITSVTLPNTVTSIGEAAFSNCTALATVTMPSSVTSIGSKAFYGTALKTVCLSGSTAESMNSLVSGTGYNTEGVTFFDPAAAVPSVDKPLEEASNGIPNWQNYVLGQDSDEPVKVEGVSTATESSVTIASTLKTPTASTGFTVKYSIDQVSADGAVVSEGEQQTSSALSIDLESITTNAFFTMKATIVNDATGAEVPVTTENVIGVMVVTNAPATTIVGVPFKSLSDDGSISVANLVHTANLSDGDELKAFDADGKLHSWTLTDGVWAPVIVQEEGQAPVMSEDADKVKLARGKGVWLTRQDPSKPIYFVGEASVEAAETELDVATDEAPKAWNMVAPPSVEPVKLNEVFTENDGSTIQVPPAREGGIPRNYTFKNGKWGYDGSENGIPKRIESDTLPSGRGFWYINKSKDPNKKINW